MINCREEECASCRILQNIVWVINKINYLINYPNSITIKFEQMEVILIATFYNSKVAPKGAASMYTLVGVHALWSWTSRMFSSGLPVTSYVCSLWHNMSLIGFSQDYNGACWITRTSTLCLMLVRVLRRQLLQVMCTTAITDGNWVKTKMLLIIMHIPIGIMPDTNN